MFSPIGRKPFRPLLDIVKTLIGRYGQDRDGGLLHAQRDAQDAR